MTKLYVANTTKQNHLFAYRDPKTNGIVTQPIPIGQQILVGNKEWKPEEAAKIIDHHSRYGMIEATLISRKRGFVGMCYRLDKAVDLSQFEAMLDGNDAALNQRASDRREEVAEMIKHNMDQVLSEAGATDNPIQRVEIETIEDTQKGVPSISEGIEVAPISRHNASKGRRSKAAN